MAGLSLLVGTLAVWRLTHLVSEEDGPSDLIVRARKKIGAGFLGQMMDCFYCLSFWIAIPFAFWAGSTWLERAILWPALSGGAILLERVTAKKESSEAAD